MHMPASVFFGPRLKLSLSALALALGLAQPALAAPVEVEFLPPEIPAQAICVAKSNDAEIVARWNDWDGATLPLEDPEAILREARRLRDIDPNRYFDTVEKMLNSVEAMPDQAKRPDTNIDRISLYLKAGRVADLRKLGLVEAMSANAAGLAPKALNVLSGMYLDGIVVKKDRDTGLSLLVSAAMGGNADALLRLARMNLAGETVPGWDLDPKLAVTMAFGALVGKLDADICDRIGRIAREYASGEVVQQDYQVSEQWYRLSADLGDPSAAWKVAGMHLASELIVKDNDVLLKYLQQAADAGVVAAQVELGKAYEAGALLPRDLEKADFYYSKAAELGNRTALIRLATVLEPKIIEPTARARFMEILERLTLANDAPGWAFSKHAKLLLEEKGRWAGEAEAMALLEEGIKRNDADSAQLLATLLMRHRDQPGNFQRASELLAFAVSDAGKIDPMTDLRNAFLCLAPEGADLRLADFWQRTEDTAGNATRYMRHDEIAMLDPDQDPITLATLQTHALYGRPNAVAYYLDYLKQHGASPDVLAFWQARREVAAATIDTVARYTLEGETSPEVIEAALRDMKRADAEGLPRAALDIASVLLDYFPGDPKRTEEAMAYLVKAANQGSGDAINRLLAMGQERGVTKEQLFDLYGSAIEDRGDAQALIFAASVTRDDDKRRDYLERAASAMDCDFESSLRLASVYAKNNEVPEAEHWLQVSLQMAGTDGWRHAAVADQYMAMAGDAHLSTAVALYEEGVELGDKTSVTRLLKIYSEPDTAGYAPAKAVAMFETLIEKADVAELADVRQRVLDAAPVIRNTVLQQVAWQDVYERHAAEGSVVAMRELAFYLQENGTTPDEAKTATAWLQKAADGGDAEAMVALAKAYAMGLGLPHSIERATALLETAAGAGSSEAQKLLATMTIPKEN